MDIHRRLANSPMIAAIGMTVFMPMTSMAAIEGNCAVVQPVCESRVTTVAPEATTLLNRVWSDADQVARRTESLEHFANDPSADRHMQIDQLKSIQAKVEDMSQRLGRLQGMEASLPFGDQHAIREASAVVRSMSTDANYAIGDLNADIAYGGYTQLLDQEARTVAQDVNRGEQSADLQERAAYYAENLGMLTVFGK